MWWPEFGRIERAWEPWRELQNLQWEMNRLMQGRAVPYSVNFPEINLWVGENDLIVTSEIPGVDPGRIDLSIKGDKLTISGSRQQPELKESETYHRQERSHGSFSKEIYLPFRVDTGRVEAEYEKGILILKLPRHEEDKSKKIEIKKG